MSEHKPFEATQGRIQRARREGDLPRSADLSAVCAFALAALTTALATKPLAEAAVTALQAAARQEISLGAYATMVEAFFAIGCSGIGGATLATVIQGGRLPFVLPKVKVDRMNPLPGLKRMVSAQTFLSALKALVAALVTASLLVPALRDALGASLSGATGRGMVALLEVTLPKMAFALVAVGLVFGLLDVFVQRGTWRKRMRMSVAEYREDLRQHEGDPYTRQRRRAAHRGLVRGSIDRLREAAFVVTNPTHIAVALEYRPPEVEVPRVLVRSIDAGALEVRRRAQTLGLPIIEERTLARELYARGRTGAYIPRDLYVPVARIVAALSPVAPDE